MTALSVVHVGMALVLSPLLPGIISRTKARVAGRSGQPLLQGYRDLAKLLRKGAVYSRTTTWVFRAGPVICLASLLAASLVVPFGGSNAVAFFDGDLVLFACLPGLGRFFTVLAALDTGSAFEGMGSSREVTFAALAEPALLLGLATISRLTGCVSLSPMTGGIAGAWMTGGAAIVLVLAALTLVFLAENARIPVDDPNTHLELTMIHEVMVLDHGGPDLAIIHYGSALKLWLLGAVIVGIAVPPITSNPWLNTLVSTLAMFLLAVGTGVIESTMARLRLVRVPQLLVGASACSILALALVFR
jgi:formate hydrogenlyase subunit 4